MIRVAGSASKWRFVKEVTVWRRSFFGLQGGSVVVEP